MFRAVGQNTSLLEPLLGNAVTTLINVPVGQRARHMSIICSGNAVTFLIILSVGLAIRVNACFYSKGIACPDEHQQYVEQAGRYAYGYSMTFWEQERGVRSPIFPVFLGLHLIALNFLGITDPVTQASVLRMVLSLCSFAVLVAFAIREYNTGNRAAAVFLLSWTSLSAGMVFITIRTTSESGLIAPFLLGVYLTHKSPFWSGILFGIAFAIRFQAGILIAGVLFTLLLASKRTPKCSGFRTLVKVVCGLSIALLACGLVDKLTYGDWFRSPIEYFRANILENVNADYGIEPWDYYLNNIEDSVFAFVLIPIFALLGCFVQWRLAIPAVAFLLVHSFVAHKEVRFIWPIIPFAFILAAAGFQEVWDNLRNRNQKLAVTVIAACSLLYGEWTVAQRLEWNCEPFTSSALALSKVGRMADATGVAVYGVGRAGCGNYFYLRKPVKLVVERRSLEVIQNALACDPSINYLIMPSFHDKDFQGWELNMLDTTPALAIYKLRR
jgi:Alg9-like mannosyltransferase family